MMEWKLNNGESPYLSQPDIHDSALLGKHNGPHTPTPTLSIYDPCISSNNNTASSWNFDHQRRNKQHYSNFITPTAAFETSTRSDINGQEHISNNKQLWVSRNEKSNDNNNNNNKSFNLTTSSSTTTTNTNSNNNNSNNNNHTLLDSFTTLSTNPLQYQQQQQHRMFHNSNDILTMNHHHHHHEIKNISSNNNNHYQSHHHVNNNNLQQLNDNNKESLDCKYPTNHHHHHHHNNRSYSMDTHPLLSYHSHHSSQHRHNSIATVQQAAAQAAAVAMSYQSHSSHSSQVWYPHTNTYQKNVHAHYDQISSTISNTALFKRENDFHHETQTYEANVTSETNFNSVISPSRLNHIDYSISTTTANPLSLISKNHHHHHSLEENENEREDMKDRLNKNNNNNNNSVNEINKSDNELKKGKKNTNSKQQQTKKRRSPNGFFVFCSARRHILKEGKTNVRNTDINRQLGDEWKALTADERDWYKREADRIRTELSNADNATAMTLQHPTEAQPFAFKHHDNSLSLTIAADDDDDDEDREEENETESIHSNNKNDNNNDDESDDLSRRTSIGSALLSSGNSSLCSLPTPSQHDLSSFDSNSNKDNTTSSVLNLASITGAAEADALDQAAAVAISSSASNNSLNSNKNDDHYLLNSENSLKQRLKRPPNSYLLYNKEMRRKLLNQNEKLSVAEKSKIISESWKTLSQERKEFYIKEAANLKRKHLEDHPDYVYSRRSREELKRAGHRFKPSKKKEKYKENEYGSAAAAALNVSIYDHENYMDEDINEESVMVQQQEESRRRKKKSENESRGRKKKKLTYPHAPKHPMSGFLFFAAYVRPEITLQCVNKRVGDISKAISARWKQLTDEEKLPWLEKAKEDKARYAREMEEFNILQKKEQQRNRNQLLDINNDNSDDDQFYNNDHNNINSKKSSISSTSSSSTSSSSSSSILTNNSDIVDQHISSSSSLSLKVTQSNHLGMINDNHQHHHLKMITNKNRPYQQHHSHLQERYFKSYSRIHSVLTTSRPASPTELDELDIARVAQMVNPTGNRHHLSQTSSSNHHHSSSSSNIQHDHPLGNVPLHVPILD